MKDSGPEPCLPPPQRDGSVLPTATDLAAVIHYELRLFYWSIAGDEIRDAAFSLRLLRLHTWLLSRRFPPHTQSSRDFAMRCSACPFEALTPRWRVRIVV